MNLFRSPFPVSALIPLCALALMSCLRDGGFVSPSEEKNLPVLATFQGRANTKETKLEGGRALNLTNPKIALVWQFVGPSAYGVTFDRFSVGANPPYKFSAQLKGPPPREIAESDEPVIGTFWLYSDGNGNDTLDRLTHPKVKAHDAELAELQKGYKLALQKLREAADESPIWVPMKDTFLLDSSGTFIHLVGGTLDTLYVGRRPGDLTWNEIMFRRYRLLKNFNGWQNFFALRKKTHDFYRTEIPTADHSYLQVFEDWRKLFPKKGMEAEFEKRLKSAGFAYLGYIGTVNDVNNEAIDSGWADYPYEGFTIPGADWVVGKSREHFVLYFPTQDKLEQVLEAERWGSFRVDNIDDMHLGYNLLNCDDQYRCKVLGAKDSVYMDLGQTEAYFNPPGSDLKYPVEVFQTVPVAADSLKPLEGGYMYRVDRPIAVTVGGGEAWIDVPVLGAHRLEPVDRTSFFILGEEAQFEFVPTYGGAIGKLMYYSNMDRAVAMRSDSSGADLAALDAKIARIRSLRPRNLSDTLPASLPGLFAYGADTLRAKYSPDGVSIELSRKGAPAEVFRPLNDSEAFSPSSENRIAFARGGDGRVAGLRLAKPSGSFFLPNLAYVPRRPADVFSDTGAAPDKPVSASGGTGRDTYVDFASKRRYACAEDSLYLKAGDGWLARLNRSGAGDEITLNQPGNGLVFKVTGQAGKRIRLDLIACGQKGGKQGGILMTMNGGTAEGGPYPDPVSERDWVRPSDKGDTVSFSPIHIPSDPYYLELRQEHTQGDSLYYSFDGYRAWSD